ncbi:hypothetical protein CGB80_01420 [Klebsiella sp. 11332]|nr:hypothetical protein [Klebsiella michiganensis]MBW6028891.1 hypothetical protein [Klebsiella sp. CVUAS 11332]
MDNFSFAIITTLFFWGASSKSGIVGYFHLFKIILLLMLPLAALVRILMLFTHMALSRAVAGAASGELILLNCSDIKHRSRLNNPGKLD